MSDQQKMADRAFRRLLAFAEDAPATPEEATERLRRAGIDVDAAFMRALAAVKSKKKEIRAALRDDAVRKAATGGTRGTRGDYAGLGLQELRAAVRTRNLAASFQNFEVMQEEDLRSLLQDADEYGDNGDEQ